MKVASKKITTKQQVKRIPVSSQSQSANQSQDSTGAGRVIMNKNIIVHQLGWKNLKQESASTNLVVGGGEIDKSELQLGRDGREDNKLSLPDSGFYQARKEIVKQRFNQGDSGTDDLSPVDSKS